MANHPNRSQRQQPHTVEVWTYAKRDGRWQRLSATAAIDCTAYDGRAHHQAAQRLIADNMDIFGPPHNRGTISYAILRYDIRRSVDGRWVNGGTVRHPDATYTYEIWQSTMGGWKVHCREVGQSDGNVYPTRDAAVAACADPAGCTGNIAGIARCAWVAYPAQTRGETK